MTVLNAPDSGVRFWVGFAEHEGGLGEDAGDHSLVLLPFARPYELRPFRLQLIELPVVAVPVEVRRGPRRFPWELYWVPSGGAFAAQRCPVCAATGRLVASKDGLGCRWCLAQPDLRPLR